MVSKHMSYNLSEATCQRMRRHSCQIDTGGPATACYSAEKPLNITQRRVMLLVQDCSWIELTDGLAVYTSTEHFHSASCYMLFLQREAKV